MGFFRHKFAVFDSHIYHFQGGFASVSYKIELTHQDIEGKTTYR